MQKRHAAKCCSELLDESDARTLRQFLINTFDGLGADAADQILKEAELGTRKSPGKLKPAEVDTLHEAMRNVNVSEGQIDERAAVCQPRAAAVPARAPAPSRRR